MNGASSGLARAFEEYAARSEVAAARLAREEEQALIRSRALQQYGSEEGVFRESELEAAISSAVAPFRVSRQVEIDGRMCRVEPDGLRGLPDWWNLKDVPMELQEAVAGASPFATTLTDAYGELLFWRNVHDQRSAFSDLYEHAPWIEIRERLLEEALATRDAQNWEDFLARLYWWDHMVDRGLGDLVGEKFPKQLLRDARNLRPAPGVRL